MGSIKRFARLYLRVLVSGRLDGLLAIFRCILKIPPSRLIGLLGLRWLIDRRPVADAIMLDMDAVDLPYVTSVATASAESTVQWNQSGSGTPTLVLIGWNGPDQASYRLVTRYTGTSVVLPVLPV